jgi:lipoprotein-anchoring transpeptidase ErfK/SrfK
MMINRARLALSLGVLSLTVVAATAATSAAPARSTHETVSLSASLGARTLTVTGGNGDVKTYAIAVGSDRHRTPLGNFTIRKIVWNPSWVPPDAKWAQGKKAADPGHPDNPMRLVKIFFREPDYYIHGTEAVESLGLAASHGCLRMDPNDAGEVALMLMDDSGISRDWDWVKGLLHLGETRTVSLQQPSQLTITP